MGVEKKIFKEIMHFNYLPLGWGHEIYNFLFPYPTYLVKIGPVVLDKKMLTHDNRRQPIAIGHLSDSGNLKNHNQIFYDDEYIYYFLVLFSIQLPIINGEHYYNMGISIHLIGPI